MHVELQAVGASGKPAIEALDCVFRPDLAAAAVRENERTRHVEQRVHGRILG